MLLMYMLEEGGITFNGGKEVAQTISKRSSVNGDIRTFTEKRTDVWETKREKEGDR